MMFTNADKQRVARALSERGDPFSSDQIVSYGRAAILKPAACLASGRVLTGPEVAERLSGLYCVSPASVTYGFDRTLRTASQIESEADVLGAEIDAMGDGDGFGADAAHIRRMRHRYKRLVLAWRRLSVLARLPRHPHAIKRSKKIFAKISRLWDKMGAKGVPRKGLTSPEALLAETQVAVRQAQAKIPELSQVQVEPEMTYTSMAPPSYEPEPYPSYAPAPTYAPAPAPAPAPTGPAPVDPRYFQDQAALERELANVVPSAFGAEENHEDLCADLRVEAMGYMFSGLEHDYWGARGTDTELIFTEPEDATLVEELLEEEHVENQADEGLPSVSSDKLETAKRVARGDEEEALSPEDAKKASKVRSTANEVRRQAKRPRSKVSRTIEDVATVASSLLPLVTSLTQRFGEAAPNGGVDYSRVRPATTATHDPVLLISLRKMGARMGADFSPTGLRAPETLTPLLALGLYREHVEPGDLMMGSRSKWPFGSDAPLPPPRRKGPEVHG